MDRTDSRPSQPVGLLADDHTLSARARRYGERVIAGTEWPLAAVDCAKITWETSTRAKRRHGRCSYDGDGRVTITLTEHTYERAGFEACKTTIRHELVHAWQYQHRGEQAVLTDSGVAFVDDHTSRHRAGANACGADADSAISTPAASRPVSETETDRFEVDTGHGDSFWAWVEPLDLPGRCSSYYDRRRSDFAYVYGCPNCGNWWGKHRLCKSVRQAAHGGQGTTGYRYCTDCEVLLHLEVGEWYLTHDDHDDVAIKTFAQGDANSVVEADLPLIHADELTPTDRSTVD